MGDYDKYTGYTKGSGAFEPVYIEYDAALAVATAVVAWKLRRNGCSKNRRDSRRRRCRNSWA
ncbi:hypothetical protein [Mucilaginibacter flavidus]|uniref:hypothetical protein n=1 Tax=Mucilaginibacter flavidus TaxID=2949309 RepID=UPI0020923D8B|nr:hypothetical protein [Mucilaginibacter flavidus]